VLIDPDFKELDGSDIRWAFELEKIPLDDFEQEYPNAEKRSFSTDDFGEDSQYWYDGKSIVVAVYSEVIFEQKTVGSKDRKVTRRTGVRQYKTNGVEILNKGPVQPGPYIPIVPVFGKELWVDYGTAAERVLLSLVSLARDPQKSLAYVMSSMLENCGQIPKASYVGAVGQFETDKDAWDSLNSTYHPYLQYDTVIDQASGQAVPAPQRVQLSPDFNAYSVGTDICRRAIQAAMGITPLPTAAQRSNQKSGVALEKIQSEQSIGSYHLVDSYDRSIKLTGRIINHWLSETDLGEMQKPVRLADGKHQLVKINTDAAVIEGDHQYHIPIADDKGRYQVTISAGPSHESQREEGSEFVDTLLGNLKNLPIAPPQAAQIIALSIRMKQLGPLGDQMADIISPQNQTAQQAQQMAQLQQQSQTQGEQMQKLQDLVQKLMLERQGRVVDNQAKVAITQMQETTKLAVAQINASKDANESFADREADQYQLLHQSAHDVALQAHQHEHESNMALQQQQAANVAAQQQGEQPQGAQ
jgi:hypothetical protein